MPLVSFRKVAEILLRDPGDDRSRLKRWYFLHQKFRFISSVKKILQHSFYQMAYKWWAGHQHVKHVERKNRPKITVWVVLVGSVLHADPQELIPNFKDRRLAESQIIKFHIHMSVHLLSAKHTPQPILTQHWTFMQPGCCRSRNKGPWNPHKRYEFRANTCSH